MTDPTLATTLGLSPASLTIAWLYPRHRPAMLAKLRRLSSMPQRGSVHMALLDLIARLEADVLTPREGRVGT